MRSISVIALFFLVLHSTIANSPKREMRAVWIATVTNIDWPSSKGLSSDQQKAEMIKMLDEFKANNINTVVFQARPCADVFYPSCIEPWCMWLSGKQGVAPYPYYDPLKFIIDEAHRRCMEVHVWINPYRALNYNDVSLFSKDHIFNKKRHLFVEYDGKYYFDPGLKETREYLNNIVKEIVENYDLDAIHFDDYFYPYPVAHKKFPDNASFFKDARGFTHKDDWRRDNVNITIKQLSKTIKSIKPWVEFGISPFGVWRHKGQDPRGSATKNALTNYDDLYADVLKWLKDGDIDYVVPQLYWEIGKKNLDYRTLVDWWSKNTYGKHLYTGLYVSGFEQYHTKAWKTPNELVRQMECNKKNTAVEGAMFFSAKTFMKNLQGLNDSLKNSFYSKPALVPCDNNVDAEASSQPKRLSIDNEDGRLKLSWNQVEEEGGKQVSYYVVYAFKGKDIGDMNNADNILGVTTETSFDITNYATPIMGSYSFVVTSVNKYRKESTAKNYIVRRF